jgi:peptide/nickel transport system substrate-binding protein
MRWGGWVLVVFVAAMLMLLAAACGTPAQPAAGPTDTATGTDTGTDTGMDTGMGEEPTSLVETDDETLRILSWQAPTILNPHLARGSKDYIACRLTYEPLATYNREGTLVPILAADIPSRENGSVTEDGRSVIWKLRPGVRWSDGEPFTASDVVFTYEFISTPAVAATSGAQYEAIEQVEALDEQTVRVTFAEPNPAWSLPFVGPRGMIIPRHIFEPYTSEAIREAPANMNPVGTGPYRVVSFVPGDVVNYERNPSYRYRDEGKPFFVRVELKGGGDAVSAARAVLQTGDADYALNLQVEAQILEQMRGSEVGTILTISKPLVEHMLLNHSDPDRSRGTGAGESKDEGLGTGPDIAPHPFFHDLRVRQALTYAIDRETIATHLYGPNGRPTSNILVEPPIYRSPNTSYEYDLERAAALLDEAGWVDSNDNGIRDKDGSEMHILFQTSTSSIRQKTQEIVKQSLESLGIAVELKSISPAVFFDNDPNNPDTYSHFSADLQMFTIPYDSPDPGAFMQGWICEEIPSAENNWSANNIERWCNPTYDALYEQSTREMDPDARRQLFIQMNDLLIEDVVLIPLVHRNRVAGVSRNIEGVDLTPWDEDVWNIQEWRRSGDSE